MNRELERVLVMGYGNPGRLDDGLGPAFAERVRQMKLPHIDTEADYQLTVEDADLICRYRHVIFVDAAVNGPEPFSCERLSPASGCSYTSHHVEPGQVLHLAQELFQAKTVAHVIGIRGYDFNEFGERLSDRAARNLEQALVYFQTAVEAGWPPATQKLETN